MLLTYDKINTHLIVYFLGKNFTILEFQVNINNNFKLKQKKRQKKNF